MKGKLRALLLGAAVGIPPRRWRNRLGGWLRRGRPNEIDLVVDLVSLLQLPEAMVDVGARYGTALAPFAQRGWRVLCFEPDARNREVLESVRRWLPQIVIDPRALSDRVEHERPFFISPGRSAMSSLLPFDESHVPSGRVEVTTLEHALTEYQVETVGFLKIDAEGNDLRVLEGLDLLGPRRPSLIMCEFDEGKVAGGGHSFRALTSSLEKARYRLIISEWFPVREYGGRHRWRELAEFPYELQDPRGHGNVLAIAGELDTSGRLELAMSRWVKRMRSETAAR